MTDLELLTELQLEIMRILWAEGEATISQVQLGLGRDLAPTTVATLLSRLERKGFVRHRTAGRQYVYEPLVSRNTVEASMLEGLIEAVFGGDVPAMVSRLLGSGRVDEADLARVKELIEARQRALTEKE